MVLERQKIRKNGNKPPVHRAAIASKGKGAPEKKPFFGGLSKELVCSVLKKRRIWKRATA